MGFIGARGADRRNRGHKKAMFFFMPSLRWACCWRSVVSLGGAVHRFFLKMELCF